MFPAASVRKRGLFAVAMTLLFVLATAVTTPAQANPRYASIVVDVATGEVLHGSNADATRYPASLTKMMTLYLVFEALEQGRLTLDQRLPVSAHAAAMPPSKLGLRAGGSITVRDAILALIVRSANDVAAVVAEALGGSESAFARQMTEKARALGMTSTTFRNASGLPDNRQVSTARDLATLSIRVLRDFPQHYHYFSTQSFTYGSQTHSSHNRLVRNYGGADGMKTGYIRASGFNVATSAVRDGRRIVAVVMGGRTAQSRDAHMADLMDRGFVRATQLALATDRPLPPVPARRPGSIAVSDAMARAESEAPRDIGGMLSLVSAAQAAAPAAEPLPANGSWSVQVGAFRVADQARNLASTAAGRLPQALTQAQVAVTEVETGNSKLYRARLIGLQEAQARSACQSLAQQGMDCLVVSPAGG